MAPRLFRPFAMPWMLQASWSPSPRRRTGCRRPTRASRPGREGDPPRRDAEWEWTEAKQCDWAWAARRAVSKQGSNSLEGG